MIFNMIGKSGESSASNFEYLQFGYTGDFYEYYENGSQIIELYTTGVLYVANDKPVSVEAYILGGGGGADTYSNSDSNIKRRASGGGGGYQTIQTTLSSGCYEISIGRAGNAGVNASCTSSVFDGGDTTAFGYTSTGGKRAIADANGVSAGAGGTPNGNAGTAANSDTECPGGLPNGGAYSYAPSGSIILGDSLSLFPAGPGLVRITVTPELNESLGFTYTGEYSIRRSLTTVEVTFSTSGTLTLNKSTLAGVYLLGGGGGSVSGAAEAGGGSGGYINTSASLSAGTHSIVIGAGGTSVYKGADYMASLGIFATASNGGDTTAFGYTATGGGGAVINKESYLGGFKGIPGAGGTPNGEAGTSVSGYGGYPNGGEVDGVADGGNGFVSIVWEIS